MTDFVENFDFQKVTSKLYSGNSKGEVTKIIDEMKSVKDCIETKT